MSAQIDLILEEDAESFVRSNEEPILPPEERAAELAAHGDLEEPYTLLELLRALEEAGANQKVADLLARNPAAHLRLDYPVFVREVLYFLYEAGQRQQADALVARLPAEGCFELFCELSEHGMQYRFGREATGSPAPPWGWDDLS